MIIRETAHHFVLTEQHEHGRLAGDIARHLNPHILNEQDPRSQEVLYACYEHDRGWIPLDVNPDWNPDSGQPFTFDDYPLEPKLEAYRQGLNEIEAHSTYAALLCSLHYASFTLQAHTPEFKQFLAGEEKRQKRLRSALGLQEPDQGVYKHFRLLQLCDDLSLYVCMNEPGATEANEHPWFKKGFPHTEVLSETGEKRFTARWKDNKTISVHPAAFRSSFQIQYQEKWLSKQQIQAEGLTKAYADAEALQQTFYMTND